jgi:hypothetical protein
VELCHIKKVKDQVGEGRSVVNLDAQIGQDVKVCVPNITIENMKRSKKTIDVYRN